MCKYFSMEMLLIAKMISFLYNDLEESCGGLCHIITDDNNIDNESLKSVIRYTEELSNKDRKDKNVSKYICESLLSLTEIQRDFLFGLYEFSSEDIFEYLNILQYSGCIYEKCDGETCPLKNCLNQFRAEKECISKTHSNEKFLNGDWPIFEVE